MLRKPGALLSLLLTSAFVSACLGDKTQEDYIRERVDRERAKIQVIQGIYSGELTSKETGDSLGGFAMDLKANISVQNSYDNTTSQLKSVIQGTLYYKGANESQIRFDQGYYDEQSHLLEIVIPMKDTSGNSRVISLHGSLDTSTLSGSIEEETSPGFEATFVLVKNGAISAPQRLSTGRELTIAGKSEFFEGTSTEEDPQVTYRLAIQYKGTTSPELFLNIFIPEHDVAVTWEYSGVPVLFSDAVLDERRNTLVAETDVSFNSLKHHIRLECFRTGVPPTPLKWDCRSTAGTSVHHAILSPSEKAL